METLLIEVHDQNGLNLLQDLEALGIIQVLQRTPKPVSGQKLSERFAGSIPKEEGEALNRYIAQSRNEWERPI
jgi:hypothetical protein